MRKKFNRLLAVMLVFIMGLTILPVTAFAEADTGAAVGKEQFDA